MSEHVIGKGTYYTIFGALMVLTILTVGIATIDLGPLNVIVALAVATVKATLVVLYFMHVKYSSKLTKLIVISSFIFLGFLIVITLFDYITRGWLGPLYNV